MSERRVGEVGQRVGGEKSQPNPPRSQPLDPSRERPVTYNANSAGIPNADGVQSRDLSRKTDFISHRRFDSH